MLFDWPRFLPALLVLGFPITLLHGRRVRYRGLSHGWSGYWGRTFALGLHAIDFGRGILGAWWLATSLSAPDARGLVQYGPQLIVAVTLTIAVTLQALVCKEPDSAHMPFAFVSGLVAGLLSPLIAGFSLVLAIVFALGIRSPMGFFPMLSCAIMAIGMFFTRTKQLPLLLTAAFVVILPWMLTLLFPRHLVASHLAGHESGSTPTAPDVER